MLGLFASLRNATCCGGGQCQPRVKLRFARHLPYLMTDRILASSHCWSDYRLERLSAQLQSLGANQRVRRVRSFFMIQGDAPLAALRQLLGPGPDELAGEGQCVYVVPRIGTVSPWSSKATDIARVCGLSALQRLERGRMIELEGASELRDAHLCALHDPMMETVLTAAAQLTLADGSRDSGDLIVVTLGAWLCDLLPELAVRVTPSRQAYAYLAPPARTRAAWAAHPMLLDIGTESGFYLVPPAAGTAMKIGDHGFSLTGHPDRQRDGRPEDVAESLAMASERIADFEEIQVEWINTCFYMVEANERFVAEQRGAAWILTGFSGHGFKFAPLIGEQLAEVIAGGLTPADFAAWISGGWISGRHGAMQDAASPK